MTIKERIFVAVLFETLAVSLSIVGLWMFTNHEVSALSGTMILVATLAMIWNYIFNIIFDKFYPGDRAERGFGLRAWYIILFEAGLLLATIPLIAYLLGVGIVEAFLMDVGITIFLTIYAFMFNLIYDHVRAAIVKKSQSTTFQT